MYRLLAVLLLFCPAFAQVQPPGVVIDHSPASSGLYIGSPGLAVLPGGVYIASHDYFGPKSSSTECAETRIFRSADRGLSWSPLSEMRCMFWGGFFVHKGALYIIGATKEYGDLVIRRSRDGGKTWTSPTDGSNGLLRSGRFHSSTVPVVVHRGRIWRAFEDAEGGGGWGYHFRALMLSAPVNAELLKASSWTVSEPLGRNPEWLEGNFGGWLEGNAVVTPRGGIADVLRVDSPDGDTAAIIEISPDGKTPRFDPAAGFVHLPGAAKKFTIRYDPKTRLYWSLSNPVPEQYRQFKAAATRNTLALVSSPDLRTWTLRRILLDHPDREKHAFQYVDWQFDGDDIIAISRTAFDDEEGGAHNAHDANYLTFHRFRNFRTSK